MLRVENVVKRFGNKEAVRGVSFEVAKGDTFGLLGPNGAGKSTTISMICGLLEPSAGEVYVKDISVRENPLRAKRLMGVVPQDVALYPTLSARENLAFWGAMYGLRGKELQSRVDEALEIVALKDRQKDLIDTYSGGMKRRVNIAASLLHRPELLIMDEPTVGIDPQSRSHILETVKRLNEEIGMTVLYTSHYMEEVEFLCRRLAIIDHGLVISQGDLNEVRHLAGSQTTVRLKVGSVGDEAVAAAEKVAGVHQARREDGSVIVLVDDAAAALPRLLEAVGSSGRRVAGVEIEEPNLEAVFLHLTGRALRD
ncbi:MAG: ABC transporter ATP-binding protein [Symbiobacteriia bacterium]